VVSEERQENIDMVEGGSSMRAIVLMVVFLMKASDSEWGSHCVNLSAHVLSFCIPGSAFAALSAARLPTNLPLAGHKLCRIRWW
jgi:hypothetical protein